MGPIGASDDVGVAALRNSWVDDRRRPDAVGAGRLALGRRPLDRQPRSRALRPARPRGGDWQGQKLLSESWIDEMRRPCPINPRLRAALVAQHGRAPWPSRPPSSYSARGAGSNVIWIDPEHDLVVVARWIEKASVEPFIRKVRASLRA